jgi:hypothetical protein
VWSNSLFKEDPDNYGLAIAMGHLQIASLWELEDVTIYSRAAW